MAGCRQPGGDFEERKREGDIREQVDDGIPHRSERFRIRDGNCELPIEWTPASDYMNEHRSGILVYFLT